MNPVLVARSRGLIHLVRGGRPLLGPRSVERVLGPTSQGWVRRTTAGLSAATGLGMPRTTSITPDAPPQGRPAGLGTAVTLSAIDLVHVPLGRIRPTCPLDAAMRAGRLPAWRRCGRLRRRRAAGG